MKKVLSAVLAGAMVASMGASAFAASANIDSFWGSYDLGDCAGISGNVLDYGTELMQEIDDKEISLWAKFFLNPNYYNATTESYDTRYVVLDTSELYQLFWNEYSKTPDSWETLATMYVEEGINYSAPPTATGTQLNGLTDPSNLKGFEQTSNDDVALQRLISANMIPAAGTSERQRQAVYNYYKGLDMTRTVDEPDLDGYLYFYDPDGTLDTTTWDDDVVDRVLSDSEIKDNDIRLYATVKENDYNIIDSVKLEDGKIQIEYASWLHTTDSADYEIELVLSFDGTRAYEEALTIKGTVENREIKVYGNERNADIDDGTVIDTIEFNEKIAIHVGAGVTIHTKLFKDKLYYGVALRQADEADDVVFAAYPDVDNVVNLYLDGINNTGDYITLSTDYAKYYVYDKDLNYLGMGDEVIQPVSSKLYLANKRLDVASESDVVEEPSSTPEQPPVNEAPIANNPTTGGDGVAANNINANPGTGR